MRAFRLLLSSCAVLVLLGACSKSENPAGKAQEAAAKGDNKSALIHYKTAVQADGSSAKLRLEFADVLEKVGDFPTAEQQLRRALELGADKSQVTPRVAAWMLDRNDARNLVREFQDTRLDDKKADADLRAIVALAWLNQGRVAVAEKELLKTGEKAASLALARAQVLGLKGDLAAAKVVGDEAHGLLKSQGKSVHDWWVLRGLARLSLALGDKKQGIEDFQAAKKALPSHFGVIGELGENLMSLGQVNEAKAELADLKKIAPGYYRTALLDALIKVNEGDLDGAYELAVKVLARVPDSVSAGLMAASIDLSRGNLATAEGRLNQVLKDTPNSVEALRLQANVAARRRDFARADKLMQAANAKAPNNPALLLDIGASLLQQGRYKEARSAIEKVLSAQPKSSRVLGLMADVEARSGNKARSMELMDQAIAGLDLEPASAEDLFRLSLRQKYADKADAIVQKVTAKKPNDPSPLLWRAIAAKEQGKTKEAMQYLLQSLDKKPDFYQALTILKASAPAENMAAEYEARLKAAIKGKTKDERISLDYLAVLRAKGGNPDALIDSARNLLSGNTESVALRSAVAELLLGAGKAADADQVISQGLSDHSKAPGMLELAATWAEKTGHPAQALERYTQLVQEYPERVGFAVKRGQLMLREGKTADGVKVLEQAVRLRPDDEDANRALAMARLAGGQEADALKVADELSEIQGRKIEGLLLKADVQIAAKKFGDAEKTVAAAQKAGAGERGVYAQVALLDVQQQQGEADKVIDAWLTKNPKSNLVLSQAVGRASRAGDSAKVAGFVKKMLEYRPDDPVLLNELAWAQASLKQPGAVDNARKALALQPGRAEIMDTLAFALSQEGKTEESVKVLRDLIIVAPGNVNARMQLAELLLAGKKQAEAKEVLSAFDATRLKGAQAERFRLLSDKVK